MDDTGASVFVVIIIFVVLIFTVGLAIGTLSHSNAMDELHLLRQSAVDHGIADWVVEPNGDAKLIVRPLDDSTDS